MKSRSPSSAFPMVKRIFKGPLGNVSEGSSSSNRSSGGYVGSGGNWDLWKI